MTLDLFLVAAVQAVSVALGAIVVGGRPLERNRAAGVFPPWWSPARVKKASEASGQVTGRGPSHFVAAVRNHRDDVVERLRRAGAMVSLDVRLVHRSRD